jgi:hypothetical protein
MTAPSLEGRRFRAIGAAEGGDVGPDTVFEYRQEGHIVHAWYAGGDVQLGFLVGLRAVDSIEFRYVQLRADGSTASGHCRSRIECLPDGRLRLHERWQWDSQPGGGSSIVEEIEPDDASR